MELAQTQPSLESNRENQQAKVRVTTEALRLAAERFAPRLVMATGFGIEGCVLTDIIGRNRLPVDIFTLDTGLFFEETYALWRDLEERCGLTIRAVRPELTVSEQAKQFGEALWERDPDRCCEMRKVLPLRAALADADAWITAVRRDQTAERAHASLLEHDQKFGLVKVNPLVDWTFQDVRDYVREHDVPYNLLYDQGLSEYRLHALHRLGPGRRTSARRPVAGQSKNGVWDSQRPFPRDSAACSATNGVLTCPRSSRSL